MVFTDDDSQSEANYDNLFGGNVEELTSVSVEIGSEVSTGGNHVE